MTPRQALAIGFGCSLALAGPAGPALAQIPGIPGAAAGAGAAGGAGTAGLAGVATPAGAAGAAGGAGGLFGGLHAKLAACKAKLCASPMGALLNGAVAPYSTLSGGLIPQLCPTTPTDAQIAALSAQGGPNGAGAVAAKVQQDEAEAKARRAAVRYLGTVDCHYWPDAEAAIISALRDDRNECVRYEATLALLNGCCCNARTVAALEIVVAGSEADGKPSETSDRVRSTALAALQGCLLRYTPPPVRPERAEPVEPRGPVGALDPAFRRVSYYYVDLAAIPPADVVARARQTVARAAASAASMAAKSRPVVVPGERSVYHALARASTAKPARAETPAPSPATDPAPAPAVASRSTGRRAIVSAPTQGPAPAEDRAVAPASAQPPAPAPAAPGRRGLFGILRDSASANPGT